MIFFNKLRKAQVIRMSAGFMLTGILFTVFSVLILRAPKQEQLQSTAVISDIQSHYDATLEQTEYTVLVEYEVNGTKYTDVPYGAYSSSMKVGDTVDILYSPENPELINAPGSENIPYVTLIIGIAVTIGSAVSLVKGIKRPSSEYEEYERVDTDSVSEEVKEEIRNSTEPLKKYYFRFCGKLNQDYVMEDEYKSPVYEAKHEKITLIKATNYDFINSRTHASKTMKIGHTVSTSLGNDGRFSYSVPISAHFKIDDVSNWDYLASLGYGFKVRLDGIKPVFDVMKYGEKVAYIETSGADIYGEKSNPLYKLPVNGYFRIECRESDIEGIFMICFCISRAIFYEND